MGSIRGEKSNNNIVLGTFFLFILVVAYFISPYFLPMYRWTEMDWVAAAAAHDQADELAIKQAESFVLYYSPRGSGDPVPWQIVSEEDKPPAWHSDIDEYQYLIRVNFVSDRTGELRTQLLTTGLAEHDRIYSASAWRLPPKTLGATNERDVLLVDMSTLSKLPIGDAKMKAEVIVNWENDDNEWLDSFNQ